MCNFSQVFGDWELKGLRDVFTPNILAGLIL